MMPKLTSPAYTAPLSSQVFNLHTGHLLMEISNRCNIVIIILLLCSTTFIVSLKAPTTFISNQTQSHPQFFQLLPNPYHRLILSAPPPTGYLKSTHFSGSALPSWSKPTWPFTRTPVTNLAACSYSCQYAQITRNPTESQSDHDIPVVSGHGLALMCNQGPAQSRQPNLHRVTE